MQNCKLGHFIVLANKMNFGILISVAQKNETKRPTAPCYQTKFKPPKKQSKQSRTLSDNIKKFLARKDEEEKQKALEEKKKKENLLSLRDQKAQNQINKHLKVCKAANKSVIEDAIDSENTAITIAEFPKQSFVRTSSGVVDIGHERTKSTASLSSARG